MVYQKQQTEYGKVQPRCYHESLHSCLCYCPQHQTRDECEREIQEIEGQYLRFVSLKKSRSSRPRDRRVSTFCNHCRGD